MSRENRIKLISAIEEKRKSKLISYITSDRGNLGASINSDVISIIHDHILSFPENTNKIDLFLYSRGGDSDVPWCLVSMFREYCKEGSFSVLIPYRAHSAATVISLGADEIVMTKKAELGPIDITLSSSPYNPKDEDSKQRLPLSVEDVMGYFNLLDKIKCERPDERMEGFRLLASKTHPIVLGTVSRLLEQTQLVALRLLNTRSQPFSEDKNRQIVKRLSSEIFSHRHTISRTEALSYLELSNVSKAEDVGIYKEMWDLYIDYLDFFNFETPFNAEEELIVNNQDENIYRNLPLACVESTSFLSLCKVDLQIKRIKKTPPQINLNLSNLNLPAINFPPNLQIQPAQLQQLFEQYINQVLQPLLQQAAMAASNQFIDSLPMAGFEHFQFNAGWKKEV